MRLLPSSKSIPLLSNEQDNIIFSQKKYFALHFLYELYGICLLILSSLGCLVIMQDFCLTEVIFPN